MGTTTAERLAEATQAAALAVRLQRQVDRTRERITDWRNRPRTRHQVSWLLRSYLAAEHLDPRSAQLVEQQSRVSGSGAHTTGAGPGTGHR